MSIRIVIVAAVRFYREGLAQALEADGQIEVVARLAAPNEAPNAIRTLDPDVVLVDVIAGSLEPIQQIAFSCPKAKMVALGVPDSTDDVLACVEAGVAGYIT